MREVSRLFLELKEPFETIPGGQGPPPPYVVFALLLTTSFPAHRPGRTAPARSKGRTRAALPGPSADPEKPACAQATPTKASGRFVTFLGRFFIKALTPAHVCVGVSPAEGRRGRLHRWNLQGVSLDSFIHLLKRRPARRPGGFSGRFPLGTGKADRPSVVPPCGPRRPCARRSVGMEPSKEAPFLADGRIGQGRRCAFFAPGWTVGNLLVRYEVKGSCSHLTAGGEHVILFPLLGDNLYDKFIFSFLQSRLKRGKT